MSEIIEIDGSFGEGGGQILRTALSLSCLLNRPFRIFNIRKGRKKPGLMPQHLACVKAMELLSGAKVQGASIGSMELYFKPGEVKPGNFFFDIGTAGSTMLVLETMFPCLAFSDKKSVVTLKGGTHVPFSPSFHYVREVFCEFLKRTGIKSTLTIERFGFYPKGGGLIRAEIEPAKRINNIRLLERGRLLKIRGLSCVANLPLSIAERQREQFIKTISPAIPSQLDIEIEVLSASSPGTGTFIHITAQFENSIAGFTALGERGKKAEAVGEEAGTAFLRYYGTDGALDPHLSDQITIYLSLAQGVSEFSTSEITRHLLTNLWVLNKFTGLAYKISGEEGRPGIINLQGINAVKNKSN
jgi:RNA 3'-terminal phosphate cyclase (ATP)